jgi:hypothetical protein
MDGRNVPRGGHRNVRRAVVSVQFAGIQRLRA